MRQKSIRLPIPIDDELVRLSETEGVDQSELVRLGLLLLFRTLKQDPAILREVLQQLKDIEQAPPAGTS